MRLYFCYSKLQKLYSSVAKYEKTVSLMFLNLQLPFNFYRLFLTGVMHTKIFQRTLIIMKNRVVNNFLHD